MKTFVTAISTDGTVIHQCVENKPHVSLIDLALNLVKQSPPGTYSVMVTDGTDTCTYSITRHKDVTVNKSNSL